jgi:thiol-disulfide isomerase/thioredoxin
MNMQWVFGGAVVIILAVGGYLMFSGSPDDAMMQDTMQKDAKNGAMMETEVDAMMEDGTREGGAMMDDEGAMTKTTGSYSDYSAEKLALAREGKVVLFFHADWCPICRPLDAEFKAKESMLSGVHILKVDYDTATSLRQKYGVTIQHTFVQVDVEGNLIAKWSDTSTLASVIAKVQ